MPCTSLERASEAVFSTGVHLNADPSVEFALAAHIVPYPNNVSSLWIYVASLTRKSKQAPV